jgi:chromosome segregation ATPase
MSERKEPGLDTAGLESIVVEPVSRTSSSAPTERAAVTPAPAGAGRGGSLLITLILLLLVAGVGYLGFTLTEQQGRLQQLEQDLTQAQQRVEVLEEMLEVTSDSAAQSGQTLQQRLEDLSGRVNERVTHVDSEIAKLWTIAYQRNKPQLDTHAEQLKTLEGSLAELGSSLKSIRQQAAQAGKALEEASAAKSAVSSTQQRLDARLKGLEQQLATLEQGLKVESEGRLKVQQQLTQQLTGLQDGQGGSAELAQRIRQNEQAISAIDGTRRQINQDLLRIRQQLNNLQLKVEQQ